MEQSAPQFISFESTADGLMTGLLSVPVGGFQVVGDVQPHEFLERGRFVPSGPWIVPTMQLTPERGSLRMKNFPVMTDPRASYLHRQFAKIAESGSGLHTKSVMKFANRFGLLGDPKIRYSLQPATRTDLPRDLVATGENFWGWWDHMHEIAALVALWDRVLFEDRAELQKYITWEDHPRRVTIYAAFRNGRLSTDRNFSAEWRTLTYHSTEGPDEAHPIADERELAGQYRFYAFPELLGPKFDVLKAARLFLYDQVNRRIWASASPQLHAERAPAEALVLVPHNLLAAIYLHFAREMAGRQPPAVPCANPRCASLVVPRWGRRYCSNKCRSQDNYYRHRS